MEDNVEALAIAELHAYIAHLESEIERAPQRNRRQGHLARRRRVAVQITRLDTKNGALVPLFRQHIKTHRQRGGPR